MAQSPSDDPFEATDDTSLSVGPGVFSADGPADADELARTGATSARWQRGGFWNRLRSHSTRSRNGLFVALSLVVLMAIVIPLGVGFFANMRREYLAEQEAATSRPDIVVLSDEVQAIGEQLDSIEAAFIMSSSIAEDPFKTDMETRVNDTNEAILANDAGSAQTAVDDAVSYFISDYSQSLPDRAATLLEQYPYSEYETEERIEELSDIIRENSGGQDLSALVAAVMELPQRIGDAMSEHLGNRVTYVPPDNDNSTSQPTQQPTPPPGTIAPAPQPSGSPGNAGDDDDGDDNGNNNSGNNGGNDGNNNGTSNNGGNNDDDGGDDGSNGSGGGGPGGNGPGGGDDDEGDAGGFSGQSSGGN